jgi:hypothetical protein
MALTLVAKDCEREVEKKVLQDLPEAWRDCLVKQAPSEDTKNTGFPWEKGNSSACVAA